MISYNIISVIYLVSCHFLIFILFIDLPSVLQQYSSNFFEKLFLKRTQEFYFIIIRPFFQLSFNLIYLQLLLFLHLSDFRFSVKMAMKILSTKEVKLNKLLQKKSEIINGNKKIKSGTTVFVFLIFVTFMIFNF